MAEHHEPGTMDITEQERTFDGFLKVCAIVILHAFVILILLAIFRT